MVSAADADAAHNSRPGQQFHPLDVNMEEDAWEEAEHVHGQQEAEHVHGQQVSCTPPWFQACGVVDVVEAEFRLCQASTGRLMTERRRVPDAGGAPQAPPSVC